MPKAKNPRRGSMQYWPRKRAAKAVPKVGAWPTPEQNKAISGARLLGFAGYKVGMTHLHFVDGGKNSLYKGLEVSRPVTVLECPPLLLVTLRFYRMTENGPVVAQDILLPQLAKIIGRRLDLPKKQSGLEEQLKGLDMGSIADVHAIVATQPSLTGIGKKVPDLMEMGISGKTVEEKLAYAQTLVGKPIDVASVFSAGIQVDVHAVSKGKGFQGPVKRFGVAIRHHKSEGTKRGPGSLGGWRNQAHVMYRVAHAGQMGYHTRTDYNKQLLLIGNDPKGINPAGGFVHYGAVKGTYVLLAGSVPGPKKRLIRFNYALYPDRKRAETAPEITSVSLVSQQR